MSFVSDSECMIANAIFVLWEALLEWSLSGVKATGVCRECQQKVKPVGSGSKCEACREWQHVWPVGSGSKCKAC